MLMPAHNTRRIIGSYHLREKIINDTVSSVYYATDINTNRDVTLRVIHTGESSEHIVQFMEQVQQLGKLKHPYVVPIQDSGIDGDDVYFTMPYYRGASLQERMNRRKAPHADNHDETLDLNKLPALFEVAQMIEDIAHALDYLHNQGVIHHQVHPTSIVFNRDGGAHLADAGLAKLLKLFLALKQTNAVHTNMYSPPEHWEGLESTIKSDQYALAAIAYELITGRQLFQSKSLVNLMDMHLNEFLIPPHYLRKNVPGELTSVLVTALAKEPEQRYDTVSEFAQAFRKSIGKVDEDSTDFFTFDVRAMQALEFDVAIGHSMDDLDFAQALTDELSANDLRVWNASAVKTDSSTLRRVVERTGVIVIILNAEDSMDSLWSNTFIKYAKRHNKPLYALKFHGVHRHRNQFLKIFEAEDEYQADVKNLIEAIRAKV